MNINEIKFKFLSIDDLNVGLLDSFNRFQEVTQVWRTINGERRLVLEPFIDDWNKTTKDEIVTEDFYYCLKDGGSVICVEYEEQVIAFSSLLRNLFGTENQYADLMQLHVSCEYRHFGLGRKLFEMCVTQAEYWGAKKLYVSSHSARETQDFYRSMGCVDAMELNEHHVNLEPFDIQMEHVIGR